jgi:nucleotide-binding universal stress UspA family protein
VYQNILLPVDEATAETRLTDHVGALAAATGASVTVLSVADTTRPSVTNVSGEIVDALEEAAQRHVDATVEALEGHAIPTETVVVQGTPGPTIANYAAEYDFDLVVMPTNARQGLSRYLLGSVTEKVVRLSTVPVLTARILESDSFAFPYERILVPVDGSTVADRAADHAIDLAAALDAAVHVLAVVDDTLGPDVRTTELEDRLGDAARQRVDDVAERARDRGVDDVHATVERGHPAATIVDQIDALDADAVVMGTTGRTGLERVFLGSVTERVVRTAPVPVVTVQDDE